MIRVLILAVCFANIPHTASADFLKEVAKPFDKGAKEIKKGAKKIEEKVIRPVAKGAKKVGKQALQTTEDVTKGALAASGLKTLEDVLIEGKSLDQSVDEVLDDGKDMLRSAAAIPTTINHIENAGVDVAKNVLGKGAGTVLGIVVLPGQFARNLGPAVVDSIIASSEGIDGVEDSVGIPLNSALKQAKQYYAGKGKPVPKKTATLLRISDAFSDAQIDRVRYVVDKDGGSIAALINGIREHIGETSDGNHAVAIDNFIIFTKEPKEGFSDIYFWAHEIQHTVQYERMGIDKFAAEYIKNYKSIENDADTVAEKVVNDVVKVLAALK